MPDYPTALPVPAAIAHIAGRLAAAGFDATIVGGTVRDHFLGRPAKDWDLATNATPDEVSALFPGTRATTRFGTALVPGGPGGAIVEITTYRIDGDYSDHRRPDTVAFTAHLDEDLARRDFTVNAMAYDPVRAIVHDPFDGLTDLRAGVLRAVGVPAERFREDALRMLRAARFAAQIGFVLDASTASAMRAHGGDLRLIAHERIGMELEKLLAAAYPGQGCRVLGDTGLLAHLVPDPTLFRHTARLFEDALWSAPPVGLDDTLILRWTLFWHEMATPVVARDTLKRWALRETLAEAVAWRLAHRDDDLRVTTSAADVARQLRGITREVAADILATRWLCARERGQNGGERDWAYILGLYDAGMITRVGELAINGDDLLAWSGRKAGKWVGDALLSLLDAVNEGHLENTTASLRAAVQGGMLP